MKKTYKIQPQTIRNAVEAIEELNELDEKLENKFIRNSYEVKFYNKLLNDMNESFANIIATFK